ncbi:hypothetical protein NSQ26_07180 [Bacillus sp. FSL W7-1360]
MSDSKIEVTVNKTTDLVRLIPVIRGYTKKSIGEIKSNIEQGEPVMTCFYVDSPEEMPILLKAIEELKSKGAEIGIYQKFHQTHREIDLTVLRNLITRDREITAQVQEMDDKMLDKD